MPKLRTILLLGLLGTVGCAPTREARLFHPWGWEDAKDARVRLDGYNHVIVARIDEHSWENLELPRLTPHHFNATVVKSYKGDWRVLERISFVHHLDSHAPAGPATNGPSGDIVFIFTREHTTSEIVLDTGEWGNYRDELAPGLEYLYPDRGR
jgi:hypothetical protein